MAKTTAISLGSSRRRKRGEMLFRFESFCQPGYPAPLAGGAFRDNVRALLGLAHLEAGAHGETKCWSFQLELHRHPPTVVRLFVVEEEVAASPHRQCHLCRHVGWGRHLICSKRFHFVLPKRESLVEADGLHYGIHHGSEKASKGTATSRGHLLHGVVHLNGFGHLIGLHGFEGGSDFVSGHQIMDLWDRICSSLHVREVSLVDTARKGHMELRLLHGVAYGDTWFGSWGYRFGRPSYGVALQSYQQSLHALRSIPLCVLVPHLSCFSQELPMVVIKYQAINGHKLLNLGDLLRFMLELRTRLPATSVTAMDYRGIMSEASCRWSAKRVDMAARAVVDALRRSEPPARWVTRQEVRDAARAYIGDTGLLDFVLKSLGNHIVGNYVVRRAMNPVTKVLEYCLEDVSSVLPAVGGVPSNGGKMRVRFQLTRAQLMRDLTHLYRHVLKEPSQALTTGGFGAIPVAVRMVLDTKHFVKDYYEGSAPINDGGVGHVHINLCCTLLVRNGSPELVAPYETVTVPAHATVGELKWEVQRLFREMYLGLRSFTAESVGGVGVGQDASPVLELIDVGSAVVVEGRVGEHQQQLADEGVLQGNEVAAVSEGGGDRERVVDCACGADDDDGERMACCDICEVWQHTRCAGIKDIEDVPHVFLCSRCDNDVLSLPSLNC
ncbi:PHD finger protein PERSISTENT TAPETAL CELL 1 [Phragmites australis]|uniref:PHD finger protein PERSISTENT TAPETAL CELL 1 n=1 Tax=Phragmites australis TaxID=29695 RepID=UPI002D7808B1|nr:PHD finger protein PERSISTENT TAPETAL CELL 1 [Phragmites australis]